MADKTNKSNAFQKLFFDIKDYAELQLDYLQVGAVEKLTKLISKLTILFLSIIFAMSILFYLLFSLAHALAPSLGFIASYAIIAGVFFILLLVLLLFRKSLVINPILKVMVDVFYDENKERKENDEDNAEIV
ncbi:MAG: phage holin family protein [Porphyromonadaceae bacterium]|nr:phage holin family protein [Porphyromonadaceae bacterium]